MSVLYALLIAFGLAIALSVAVGWIHEARTARDARPQPTEPADAQPAHPPARRAEPPAELPPVNDPWGRMLLHPNAVLGAVALLIQPVVIWTNSFLLSQTLVVLYDIIPEPLFTFTVFGVKRDVTVFDAVAVSLTLGQMLTAAVAARAFLGEPGSRRLSCAAFLAWLALASFEVWASSWRVLAIGGSLADGARGGLVALGIVLLEGVSGVLLFDSLLVPLILACASLVVDPVRGIRRLLAGTLTRVANRDHRARLKPARAPCRGSLLRTLDDLLQPLRDLDRIVYDRVVARLLPESHVRNASLVLLLLLFAADKAPLSAQALAAPAPRVTVDWYVAIDETKSVPAREFEIYKSEMFPRLVLAHVRSLDRLFVLTIDRTPEERVEYLALDGGRFTRSILRFYREKVETIAHGARSGKTDFGAVLSFISNSATARSEDRPRPLPVVVILTDGAPFGQQTTLARRFPTDAKLFIFGVKARNDPALRSYLKRLGISGTQYEIAPFAGWPAWVDAFSQKIGRPKNTELLQMLRAVSGGR